MLPEKETLELLTQLGITRTQATLYLALLKLDEADAKTLSLATNLPRPQVYRTLDELQKKGLVEKEIAAPYRFKATPIHSGLQIVLTKQHQQFKETQEKTRELLKKIEGHPQKSTLGKEVKFKLRKCEGRERILQKISLALDNTQQNLNVVSTLSRLLQVIDSCFEEYEKVIARGVECQIVVEEPEVRIDFPENLRALTAKPNFELRFSRTPFEANAAIYDQREAIINFFPSKSFTEAPVIWTNHPSFISMCQDHFRLIWETAEEYKLEKKNY